MFPPPNSFLFQVDIWTSTDDTHNTIPFQATTNFDHQYVSDDGCICPSKSLLCLGTLVVSGGTMPVGVICICVGFGLKVITRSYSCRCLFFNFLLRRFILFNFRAARDVFTLFFSRRFFFDLFDLSDLFELFDLFETRSRSDLFAAFLLSWRWSLCSKLLSELWRWSIIGRFSRSQSSIVFVAERFLSRVAYIVVYVVLS